MFFVFREGMHPNDADAGDGADALKLGNAGDGADADADADGDASMRGLMAREDALALARETRVVHFYAGDLHRCPKTGPLKRQCTMNELAAAYKSRWE